MKNIRFSVACIVSVLIVGALAAPRLLHWYNVRTAERLLERPLPMETVPSVPSPSPSPSPSPIPAVNLPVPFTPQAPHADWGMPYREACEEAAALMAIRYAFGNPILSPEDADTAILDLVRANGEILGYPVDQTAAQVRDLILAIDPAIHARLVRDPTVDILKGELMRGNVIVVPAAGRKLKNPFYRRPGPLYHMLVLRGYTADGYFITNDPGTKRGEGYVYPFERIMEAMGDWNGGDPAKGEKVVIVVEPLVADPDRS